MLMRHEWQFKADFNAGLSAATAEQGMEQFVLHVVGKGDGWVLAEIDGGLILTQAMGVGDGGDSIVIVVAATENEPGLAVCNLLSDYIRAAKTL